MSSIWCCPPLPEAAKLCDIAGMLDDIRQALKYVAVIEKQIADNFRDIVVLDGLASAAAVSYARCFTTSAVRDRLPRDFVESAPPGLQETHRYVRAMRNKHIAHSDNGYEHNYLSVRVALANGQPEKVEDATVESRRMVPFSDPDIPQLRTLFEWIEQRLLAMYEDERQVVLRVLKAIPVASIAEHRFEPPYLFLEQDAHLKTRPR
jgi:hypothetical protein